MEKKIYNKMLVRLMEEKNEVIKKLNIKGMKHEYFIDADRRSLMRMNAEQARMIFHEIVFELRSQESLDLDRYTCPFCVDAILKVNGTTICGCCFYRKHRKSECDDPGSDYKLIAVKLFSLKKNYFTQKWFKRIMKKIMKEVGYGE